MSFLKKKAESTGSKNIKETFTTESSELYRLDEFVKIKNPYILFLVEILKELHEIKESLNQNNDSSDSGNQRAYSTD